MSALPGFETRLAFIDDAIRRVEENLARIGTLAPNPDAATLTVPPAPQAPWRLDQAEIITAASCPTCGELSQAITPSLVTVDTPNGPTTLGFLFCACRHGHSWPMLDVFDED